MSRYLDYADYLSERREAERDEHLSRLKEDGDLGCICRHMTSDPERGCECGYEDWLCDHGGEPFVRYEGAEG
jgi:hypothetical protein